MPISSARLAGFAALAVACGGSGAPAPGADRESVVLDGGCPWGAAVRGRVLGADGRPAVAELRYSHGDAQRYYSLNDGTYAHELRTLWHTPARLWVRVMPLYPGRGDAVDVPVPPVHWRPLGRATAGGGCVAAAPPETAVVDVRLPPGRGPVTARRCAGPARGASYRAAQGPGHRLTCCCSGRHRASAPRRGRAQRRAVAPLNMGVRRCTAAGCRAAP